MRYSSVLPVLGLVMLTLSVCGNTNDNEKMSESSELIKEGDELFNKQEKAEALEIFKAAADTAQAQNDNSDLTEAYAQIARCYLSMDKKEEGRPWLEKAEKIANDTEPLGWTRYLGVKGRYLWKDAAAEQHEVSPVVEEAAAVFTQMYDYAVEHQLHERAIDAANMMSIVGARESRAEWALKGIKAAEEGGLRDWLAPLWNNLGWTYDDMGKYDKSLEALMEARRYHYIKGNERSMLIADWSVAHAYRMTGQLDSALTWAQRASLWARDLYTEDRSPESAEWVGWCYKEIGEAALARGNKDRALAGFRSARIYFEQAHMREWDEKGYNELLSKIEKLTANEGKKR
jgi:tetratricopeptide (TPR) repeat protein